VKLRIERERELRERSPQTDRFAARGCELASRTI
jgi:hypothetical protein